MKDKNSPFEIKVESTFDKGFQVFYFSTREGAETYVVLSCETCGKNVISLYYSHVIRKLKKAGLLSKDYKEECCYCYNIRKVLGFVICKDCGTIPLNILKSPDNKMHIYCPKCRRVYYINSIIQ